MRSMLIVTCIAVCFVSTSFVAPARAEVTVSVPGIAIETGRDHHADRRESFRDERMRHESVRTEHCDHDCRR